MPGLAGIITEKDALPTESFDLMLETLQYGLAKTTESFSEVNIGMGCVHLGTGGQRAIFHSSQTVVMFYGYLTEPTIPPGFCNFEPSPAAHFIHDLYLAEGEAFMMNKLAGTFAFALWDKITQTLFLVSDHLGLRPIYYAKHNGMFRFASEVKGILSDSTFPHRLNRTAIAEFIHFSYVLGSKTFFQDINMLPPASILRFHGGDWTISRYWDIAYPESYPNHPDSWYDELVFSALQGAVKRMANANIRFGLSLSGGMDSRWIAAFLSQFQSNSSSYTIGIPGSDDTYSAKAVALRTNLSHHYWDLSPSFVAELAESFNFISDGMYDLFSFEEFPLIKSIAGDVDVSIGGLLGDCLFGHEINPISANSPQARR